MIAKQDGSVRTVPGLAHQRAKTTCATSPPDDVSDASQVNMATGATASALWAVSEGHAHRSTERAPAKKGSSQPDATVRAPLGARRQGAM